MRSVALCSVCARFLAQVGLLIVLVLPHVGRAQTREVVFGDALDGRWFAGGWPCLSGASIDIRTDAPGEAGGVAVEADHAACGEGGWGALSFDRRASDWATRYWIYPNQAPVLTFRFNPGADPEAVADLQLTLDLVEETVQPLARYLPAALAPNEWVNVRVPLLDIADRGVPFARFVLWNTGSRRPHYRLAQIALEFAADRAVPQVAGLTVEAGPDSAVVRWQTDEYARGTLAYTDALGTHVVESSDYTRTHVLRVGGLQPSTAYPFVLSVSDHQEGGAAPNTADVPGTITTLPPDAVPPALDGAVTVAARSDRAVVTFRTNELALVRVEVDGCVIAATQELSREHRVVLVGLAPQTAYRYRLILRDRFDNEATVSPAPDTFTTRAVPTAQATVDAAQPGRPFSRDLLGHNLGQWTSMWGRLHPADSPKTRELLRLIRPGVLRYAGGLLSNDVTWDRTNRQRYPSGWVDSDGDGVRETWSGRDYYRPAQDGWDRCGATPVRQPGAYHLGYQADEVDRVAALARYVGADVMVEANVTTCDPGLWADMVRYANVEKGYGFKYWEIGNELDLERINGKDDIPVGLAYVQRFKRYADSLRAADPAALIAGPTTASLDQEDGFFRPYPDYLEPLTSDPAIQGRLGLLTAHLYPLWRPSGSGIGYRDMFRWHHPERSRGRAFTATHIARLRHLLDSRGLTNVPIGLTEFSAMAFAEVTTFVSNHAGALYHADMLGRLATSGVDLVTNWLLYDLAPEVTGYGLINHQDRNWVTRDMGTDEINPASDDVSINPLYYTYFGYAQFFGDRLVAATTNQDSTLSLWASTDSRTPGAVKLLLTNLSDEPVDVAVDLRGVRATVAQRFDLASTGFVQAPESDRDHSFVTTINGRTLDLGSPASVVESARQILASGQPVALDGGGARLTLRVGAYEATWVVLNQAAPSALPDPMLLEAPGVLPAPPRVPGEIGWRSAVGAYEYTAEVVAAPAEGAPAFEGAMVYRRLSETTLVPGGLVAGRTYAARVRAEGPGGVSAWTDLGRFTVSETLPVELVTFTATAEGAEAVHLAWETAAEHNNAGFYVEMRAAEAGRDGSWQTQTFVPAAGAAHTYTFRVPPPAPGRYAFRLRQVDLDGRVTTHAEVAVAVEVARVLALRPPAPNPVRQAATLRFTVPEAGLARLVLFDALGRQVATLFDGEAAAGIEHRARLDAATLAPGLYVARLRFGRNTLTQSVLIAR